MSPVGELEGGSVEPLLPSVTEFGVVEVTVDESTRLAQLEFVVVCGLTVSGQVLTLSASVYTDCMVKFSMLLGVSSVPLDKLPWQKYHPASLSFSC